VSFTQGSTGTTKTPPCPYQVPRGYGYCRGTTTCVPPAYPFFTKKKKKNYGTGRVGPIQGGIKLSQNDVVLRLNSNPIYLLHPILSHSMLFSLTRFSLFSALDSLSSLLSILSVSDFLTPRPVHSVLSFSLPHSIGDGQRNGRGDCGSEDLRRAGDPRTSLIVNLIVVFFYFFSHFESDCSDCGMGLWYFC
jgi:hypothetical protein